MGLTLLDGGMGQELVARSPAKPTGLWSTQALIDAPDLIRAVHDDYFSAGADIATTNTYAIHRDRLRPFDLEDRFLELHRQACTIAVRARDAHGGGMVAGSMGPTSHSYRPDLAPPEEEAAELFAEIAREQAPYVDLILCETMSSVAQARGAIMGAKVVDKPVWLAVSVEDADGSKLRSGEPVAEILPLIEEFTLDAVLVNCSPPEAVGRALTFLVNQGIPTGGYANGFVKISEEFLSPQSTVEVLEKRQELDPENYADFVGRWIADGAEIVGGCCEVGPAHIAELARKFKG